jgi:hypothetical protein
MWVLVESTAEATAVFFVWRNGTWPGDVRTHGEALLSRRDRHQNHAAGGQRGSSRKCQPAQCCISWNNVLLGYH